MRILGVDPGSEATGYGLIESDGSEHKLVTFGTIRTPARRPFQDRLFNIYTGLIEILSRNSADVLAVESVFHAANVQSALKLGHARGIVLLAAAQQGIPVYEYSPLEVKRGITGYGRAEKSQVQGMVRFLLHLPEPPAPDDAADALALAICHAHRMRSQPAPVGRRTSWRSIAGRRR